MEKTFNYQKKSNSSFDLKESNLERLVMSEMTNDVDGIYKTALELLKTNYDGRPIRLIGVTLQQLVNPKETYEQLSIFDDYEQIKEENETRLLIGDLNRAMHKSVFKTVGDHLRENPNGSKRS